MCCHIPLHFYTLCGYVDCIGGDSKTLMMVQVSPVEKNAGETVCSLNFAQRVRVVELGQATKKTSTATPKNKRFNVSLGTPYTIQVHIFQVHFAPKYVAPIALYCVTSLYCTTLCTCHTYQRACTPGMYKCKWIVNAYKTNVKAIKKLVPNFYH